jgi:hypothetical protein
VRGGRGRAAARAETGRVETAERSKEEPEWVGRVAMGDGDGLHSVACYSGWVRRMDRWAGADAALQSVRRQGRLPRTQGGSEKWPELKGTASEDLGAESYRRK